MGSLGYILRRLLQLIPLLLGVVLVSFLLLRMAPGDPATLLLGPRASEEQVADKRAELGLDESLPQQFLTYAGDLAQGDLGESIRSREAVTTVIADRFVVTAWILTGTFLLALAIAIPLAILAVQRPGGTVDTVTRATSMLGYSLPGYWVGIMLILVFALRLDWFPVQGFGEGFWGHVHSIFLPSLTLAISVSPVLMRSLRSSMLDVLGSEHVTTARALGWSGWPLYRDHVIRNAIPPVVTLMALQVGYLLFGTVLVEQIFLLPGLGQTIINAVVARDFAVVQGITLIFAVIVVMSQLIADLIHGSLDPRIRR
jgi:peptide/nickel transport system permease protein